MAAAIRIAHSLGETAEIFRDDRVMEVIDVLANFSFEYLQKLVTKNQLVLVLNSYVGLV